MLVESLDEAFLSAAIVNMVHLSTKKNENKQSERDAVSLVLEYLLAHALPRLCSNASHSAQSHSPGTQIQKQPVGKCAVSQWYAHSEVHVSLAQRARTVTFFWPHALQSTLMFIRFAQVDVPGLYSTLPAA